MSRPEQRKRPRKNSSSNSDDGQSRSKKLYADGYDDEYRGNADDRDWLNTLTERERETELLKRHEQRETLHHREEISRKLQSKKTTEDDETRTKSSEFDNDIYADDDDDDYRGSANRRKQVNASKQKETQHSKTLQALIEERKKRQDGKTRKPSPKPGDLSSSDDEPPEKSSKTNEKEKLTVAEVYASSTSESESDDDDDNRTASAKANRRQRSRSPENRDKASEDQQEANRKKCTPISTKSELKSMIISRFRMEKWCHAPFFPKVAKGAFVRINIGQNNGTPVYRVCEIRDVVETAKVYNLGATRTNKGLRLKHGHNERVFRLEFVSNSEISDAEFKRWREAAIKQGVPLPTLQDVERKMKAIDQCKHYVLSNAEISKIVEEKSRFRKTPINYAMAKNELLKEIEIARDENDTVRETELQKKMTEMEERATQLDRTRSQNISVIAQINQRNRKNTQENVELAIAREAQRADSASDPFTRRRCAPVLVSKAPQTKDELIRQLHSRRAAEEEEAAAKKKVEEQRLVEHRTAVKQATSTTTLTATTVKTITLTDNGGLSAMTTRERGSFTMLADNSDEMFTSHDFELDFTIKLLPE